MNGFNSNTMNSTTNSVEEFDIREKLELLTDDELDFIGRLVDTLFFAEFKAGIEGRESLQICQ